MASDVTSLQGDFDYIVVGAGSAGCVVANRLSADQRSRVLVLEAGGRDNWIWFHIPVGYLFAIGNPRSDWMFETEKEAGLNGRSLNYPRGKVIGGCSAINAMIVLATFQSCWRLASAISTSWRSVKGPGSTPTMPASRTMSCSMSALRACVRDLRRSCPRDSDRPVASRSR